MIQYKKAAFEVARGIPYGPAVALSLDKAIKLFNHLADQNEFGWGYVRTACYPRAYLACEAALQRNLKPMKAWAFEDETPLKGVHLSSGEFRWSYHVALALPVQLPSGQVENLVFDPALFAAPVSLQEWNSVIGAKPERLIIQPYNVPPSSKLAGPGAPRNLVHTLQLTEQAWNKVKTWRRMAPAGQRLVYESQTLKDAIKSRPHKTHKGWKIFALPQSASTRAAKPRNMLKASLK